MRTLSLNESHLFSQVRHARVAPQHRSYRYPQWKSPVLTGETARGGTYDHLHPGPSM